MSVTVEPYQKLFQFSKNVFLNIGCNEEDAILAANVLLSADLRGIDSHGIARLSGYVRLWDAERVNTNPNLKIIHQTPSTATLDGDRALGLVSAPKAMQIAIDKAKLVGTGWVCVQNSNHFGIAGYHAMLALEHDMIGICMTNASPLVAPTFSLEKLLGTNPICVAVPAGEEPSFVADFATTTAANGKLEILQRKNGVAPVGWIQNKNGKSSTDPHELKVGGALLIEFIKDKNYNVDKRLGDTSNTERYRAYSIMKEMENYPKDSIAVIIDCGVEDFIIDMSRIAHQKMLSLKIPHDYIERPGRHDWNYWRTAVEYQLLFFRNYFDRNLEVGKLTR